MKALDLAQKFMDIVFTTGEFDKLRNILADDLQFRGPLYNFDTAEDYINAMKAAPPEDFEYEMVKSFGKRSSACLIYKFTKPGVETVMTQVFEVENQKIQKIILIFDTAVFR